MNLKYKKYLVLLAILSLSSFLFSFFVTKKLALVSSIPANNSNLNIFTQPILLQFNQSINLGDFKFQISPEEPFTPSQDEKTRIILTFSKVFQINTNYLLTIFYKGKQMDQINFNTNIPSNTQYDARFLEDVQNNMDNKYPLMAKTPYETKDYRVVYSAPLTLEITLKSSNLTSSDAISAVKSWVTQNGGDSMAHKYVIGTGPIPSPQTGISTPLPTPTKAPTSSPSLFEYAPAE